MHGSTGVRRFGLKDNCLTGKSLRGDVSRQRTVVATACASAAGDAAKAVAMAA